MIIIHHPRCNRYHRQVFFERYEDWKVSIDNDPEVEIKEVDADTLYVYDYRIDDQVEIPLDSIEKVEILP